MRSTGAKDQIQRRDRRTKRVQNKLKLEQELNEMIAEEAVREEALPIKEHPFEQDEIELPKETPEQFYEQYGSPSHPSNHNRQLIATSHQYILC